MLHEDKANSINYAPLKRSLHLQLFAFFQNVVMSLCKMKRFNSMGYFWQCGQTDDYRQWSTRPELWTTVPDLENCNWAPTNLSTWTGVTRRCKTTQLAHLSIRNESQWKRPSWLYPNLKIFHTTTKKTFILVIILLVYG